MKKVVPIIAIVLLLLPAAAFAAGGSFTDDDSSLFEANIEWLALAGVTKGCNPPGNDRFCPDDNVTRGQMAAFMQRFAQYLGAEDGQVSNADHADDADLLGGLSAQDLVDQSPLAVGAADFNPDGGGTYGEYYLSWGGTGWTLMTDFPGMCLQAPVSVPRGAELVSVDIAAIDQSGSGNFMFHSAPIGNPAAADYASGTSVASTDVQVVTIDVSGVTRAQDSQNWIGVCLNSSGDYLYGALVSYTIASVPTGTPAALTPGSAAGGDPRANGG